MNTGFIIGQKVWDIFLKREDVITDINIHISKDCTEIKYKLSNHTSWVSEGCMALEEGCSCPPKKNYGSPFDGVSYYCPKHGR